MVGSTTVNLPVPIKIGRVYFNIHKRCGFEFDNTALLLLLDSHPEFEYKFHSLQEYAKKNEQLYLIEHMYFAQIRYYQKAFKKPVFNDLNKFTKSIGEASQDSIKEITQAIIKAESFGAREVPGKKKA